MTRFSDDRVREETPHNPLARSKKSDENMKISVKDLMNQIDDLTAAERDKNVIVTVEKARRALADAERIKANAKAEIDSRVEEEVNRICRFRENAYEEGYMDGRKRAEHEFCDLVDEIRKKYKTMIWLVVFTAPTLAFFLTRMLIDYIWRII
jgi:flagellar biosynthesis/type III secretory pathway protein FliH